MNALQKHLKSIGVTCPKPIEWAGKFRGRGAFQRAWDACEDGDWMQLYIYLVDFYAWHRLYWKAIQGHNPDNIRKHIPKVPK